jgi:drug/metabolite transporter (DMT)-like permease
MTLAVVLALCGGLCYALASVIQQRVAAQQPPELSLSPRLVVALAHRPLWLAGIAVDVAAYGFEAAALGVGSILVVGPLLCTGLLFALPFATFRTGRHVTRFEMIPAVMVTAGLALYVQVGAPAGTASHAPRYAWVLAFLFVGVVAGTAVALGRRTTVPGRRATYYGFATGVVYSLTAVLTKATVDRLTPSVLPILGHWQLYALVLVSIVGLILNQSAFQAGHVAASLPAMSVTNPVLASAMGVVLFGEHLTAQGAGEWFVVSVAIAAMLVGTLWLARSPLVTQEVSHVPALEV